MNLDDVKGILPAQILEIADAIGLPATQRLVEQLGGTTWPVAKGTRRLGIIRHTELAKVIGEDAATIIARQWGGVPLYIPRCETAIRHFRDLKINAQFEQGIREGISTNTLVNELARAYKLSDRRIWKILKQPFDTSAKGDLFE